jgi:hypothetical protein
VYPRDVRCDECNEERRVTSQDVIARRPVMITCVAFDCRHRQHFVGTRLTPCDCVPATEPASRPMHPHVVLTDEK